MNDKQVLTNFIDQTGQKDSEDQPCRASSHQVSRFGHTSIVHRGSESLRIHNQRPDDWNDVDRHGDRCTRNPKKTIACTKPDKHKGGWPVVPRLRWRHDVRAIYDIAHEMEGKGIPFTHFISIMPTSGGQAARKRTCSKVIGHLGQVLKRHGHPHYGLTIIEHSAYADLHAHLLVHVPDSEREIIEAWTTGNADVRVSPITRIDGLLSYLTKERQRLSPDCEADIRKRRGPQWRRCLPVVGKRWTTTNAVRELLGHSANKAPQRKN